jgi:hypothetical protein
MSFFTDGELNDCDGCPNIWCPEGKCKCEQYDEEHYLEMLNDDLMKVKLVP